MLPLAATTAFNVTAFNVTAFNGEAVVAVVAFTAAGLSVDALVEGSEALQSFCSERGCDITAQLLHS
jgi:hypothetical protein